MTCDNDQRTTFNNDSYQWYELLELNSVHRRIPMRLKTVLSLARLSSHAPET